MKLFHRVLTLAVLSIVAAGQYPAHSQGFGGPGGPGGPGPGLRVVGPVTAVDTTADLITIQAPGPNAVPVTVKYNSDTKYTKQDAVPLTNLKVGGFISVISVTPPQQGDTTIDSAHISILSALPTGPGGGGGFGGGFGGGYGRRARPTIGTIATTTPSLSITTLAGDTVTVTTDANTIVSQTDPATISDVTVGSNVQISGKTDSNATLFATDVALVPAPQPRPGG